MKRIRRIIVAGLLIWLPLGVTIFIIRLLLDLLGQTYKIIPEFLMPEGLLGFSIPGFGILLSIVIIFMTGLIAANYIGRSIVDWWEAFLDKIPFGNFNDERIDISYFSSIQFENMFKLRRNNLKDIIGNEEDEINLIRVTIKKIIELSRTENQ